MNNFPTPQNYRELELAIIKEIKRRLSKLFVLQYYQHQGGSATDKNDSNSHKITSHCWQPDDLALIQQIYQVVLGRVLEKYGQLDSIVLQQQATEIGKFITYEVTGTLGEMLYWELHRGDQKARFELLAQLFNFILYKSRHLEHVEAYDLALDLSLALEQIALKGTLKNPRAFMGFIFLSAERKVYKEQDEKRKHPHISLNDLCRKKVGSEEIASSSWQDFLADPAPLLESVAEEHNFVTQTAFWLTKNLRPDRFLAFLLHIEDYSAKAIVEKLENWRTYPVKLWHTLLDQGFEVARATELIDELLECLPLQLSDKWVNTQIYEAKLTLMKTLLPTLPELTVEPLDETELLIFFAELYNTNTGNLDFRHRKDVKKVAEIITDLNQKGNLESYTEKLPHPPEIRQKFIFSLQQGLDKITNLPADRLQDKIGCMLVEIHQKLGTQSLLRVVGWSDKVRV